MNSYLERLRVELEDAASGASADALVQAPAGKWNATQILEHIFLTYKVTNRGLGKMYGTWFSACHARRSEGSAGGGGRREFRIYARATKSAGTGRASRHADRGSEAVRYE